MANQSSGIAAIVKPPQGSTGRVFAKTFSGLSDRDGLIHSAVFHFHADDPAPTRGIRPATKYSQCIDYIKHADDTTQVVRILRI